jgi:hypothetical protein
MKLRNSRWRGVGLASISGIDRFEADRTFDKAVVLERAELFNLKALNCCFYV